MENAWRLSQNGIERFRPWLNMNRTPRLVEATGARHLESRSPDGRISFALRVCDGGVYAERHQIDPSTGRLVQSIVFRDEASFVRWCEADAARFDYPLVCGLMRRTGCEFFARTAPNDLAPRDFGSP